MESTFLMSWNQEKEKIVFMTELKPVWCNIVSVVKKKKKKMIRQDRQAESQIAELSSFFEYLFFNLC